MATSTKQKVLGELLKERDSWHSGDALAKQFTVTRETIWKAVRALKQQGVQIASQKKRGYQYQGCETFNADVINYMSGNEINDQLHVFDEVTSTQSLAKEYLSQHSVMKPIIWLADHQIAGYGRRGRKFYSPTASGLYLSLLLPNPSHNWPIEGSLIINTAVTITKVLKQFFPQTDLKLKWVNDLYLKQRKVAGIITEADLDLESHSPAAFIIGMGLNLTTAHFPKELQTKAMGIDSQATIDRNQIAAHLIQSLLNTNLLATDINALDYYRQHALLTGKMVDLSIGNQQVNGVVKGISDTGGLILELPDGKQKIFTAGEVTKVNW